MTNEYKRDESVSAVLTEIRTVLSRAKTARWNMENARFIVEEGYHTGKWPNMTYVEPITIEHPDRDYFISVLDKLIEDLQPFENRKKKWHPPR